jgi:hypothetical protein
MAPSCPFFLGVFLVIFSIFEPSLYSELSMCKKRGCVVGVEFLLSPYCLFVCLFIVAHQKKFQFFEVVEVVIIDKLI